MAKIYIRMEIILFSHGHRQKCWEAWRPGSYNECPKPPNTYIASASDPKGGGLISISSFKIYCFRSVLKWPALLLFSQMADKAETKRAVELGDNFEF